MDVRSLVEVKYWDPSQSSDLSAEFSDVPCGGISSFLTKVVISVTSEKSWEYKMSL